LKYLLIEINISCVKPRQDSLYHHPQSQDLPYHHFSSVITATSSSNKPQQFAFNNAIVVAWSKVDVCNCKNTADHFSSIAW
jgi:hypothetical protein